ncbi:MAG: ABC transporter substrate-binding protein [Spirochaetota bacterium]
MGNEPSTLDPAKMTEIYASVVIQQVVEGLVQYTDNLMVVPCIANSWESSGDNLRWVFHLKKGVKFHNGREVRAGDFVYSFTRILDPRTGSRAASLLSRIKGAEDFMRGKTGQVEGIKAAGPYTLEITLSEPFPPFISVLAMVNFGAVPREEVENPEKDFGHHPVGTGPFTFEYWKSNKEIVLEANRDYHEGRPYLDRIVFRIFPGASIDKMFNEFKKGSLEDSSFPVGKRDEILNSNYQLLQRPAHSLRMLVINTRHKYLENEKVRKALNYAINKKEISEKVGKGRLIPATSLIPPGMPGYRPDDRNYPYSPEKASKLLKEAGFPGGRGLPVIQYWSSVKSEALLEEDKAIKEYLSNIGVELNINCLTDWPAFKKMLQQGKAPIFKYSWEADVPDPDNILSSLFHSRSTTNRSFYKNPQVDALLEKAQNERDYHRRISLYSEIQDMVMEDAPVVLLNYLAYERVFQPYVRNFEGKALGDHYFSLKRVWLDHH